MSASSLVPGLPPRLERRCQPPSSGACRPPLPAETEPRSDGTRRLPLPSDSRLIFSEPA